MEYKGNQCQILIHKETKMRPKQLMGTPTCISYYKVLASATSWASERTCKAVKKTNSNRWKNPFFSSACWRTGFDVHHIKATLSTLTQKRIELYLQNHSFTAFDGILWEGHSAWCGLQHHKPLHHNASHPPCTLAHNPELRHGCPATEEGHQTPEESCSDEAQLHKQWRLHHSSSPSSLRCSAWSL